MTEKINRYGDDSVMDFFVDLQVWGTPQQCYERIMDIHGCTGHGATVGVFSYGGMDYADAEASMRLFAAEVAPQLKQFQPAGAV